GHERSRRSSRLSGGDFSQLSSRIIPIPAGFQHTDSSQKRYSMLVFGVLQGQLDRIPTIVVNITKT
ncbi:MAG: hypothetical protein ACK6DF_14820, partial [Betaproteobacteria bacterium]